MSSVPEIVVGNSKYITKEVEGRACYVLEADPTNLDFTFQEKFDKATGSSFFVNVSHRIKVWVLPDITVLPPMEDLPGTISTLCTRYTPIEATGTDDPTYAPEVLPVEITANHCWVALPDTLRRRYFFVNAGSGAQRTDLPASTDFAQRIARMYKQYKIGNEESLLSFLTDYAGREDEGLQRLVDDYGDEDSNFLQIKDRVVAAIRKFDPKRIHKVCKLLDDHEDVEEELFAKLEGKYGTLPQSYRERVSAMLEKYDKDRLGEVNSFMSRFAGKEVALLSALVTRYGPEPPQAGIEPLSGDEAAAEKAKQDLRDRAMFMFLKYAPDRNLNNAFEEANDKYDNEQALLDALISKHGAEPTPEERPKLLKGIVDVEKAPPNVVHESFRDRLVNFLAHYNPKKVDSVDKMLVRYSGHEEELMEQLVTKYGPEPPMDSTPKPRRKSKKGSSNPDTPRPTGSEPNSPAEGASPAETPASVPDNTNDGASPSNTTTTPADVPATVVPPVAIPPLATPVEAVVDAPPAISPRSENPSSVQTPRFQLSKEELKNRCHNLLLVHDPEMIPTLAYVMTSVKNGEETLYRELLDKYGSDPAPELVEMARLNVDASNVGDAILRLEEEERRGMVADEQVFRLQVLSRELEAARSREAALRERDEARLAEEERQRRLEAEALQALEEVEERRRASEKVVNAALDKSEFAENLDVMNRPDAASMMSPPKEISLDTAGGWDGREDSGFGGGAPSRAVPTATLVNPSGRSTMTLIGTLAALEEKLQRAYTTMEATIRKGDTLRVHNTSLQQEIRDLHQEISTKEKELKLAIVDAQNQAEKHINDNERARLDMLTAEHEGMTKVMASIHSQQADMNEERLRMAKETRQLREEVDKERDMVQAQHRTIRTLESKVHRCEEDEVASRAAIRLLEERLASQPETDSIGIQTQSEDELFASLAALTSPHRSYSDPQSPLTSSIRQLSYRETSSSPGRPAALRESVMRMEAELEEWRRKAASLREETETARHERNRANDEYASALRVISILRSKNKKLEERTKGLELQVLSAPPSGDSQLLLSSPGSPSRSQLVSNNKVTVEGSSPSVPDMSPSVKILRMEATELREKLRVSEAESRALKREIVDLRGLLAIKMAIPKR